MKTAKEALANHLWMDMADLSEYNYHAGHYSRAVYNVKDSYYCAAKTENDLPKPRRKSGTEFKWVEVTDNFVNKYGWKIFKHEGDVE